VKLWQPSGSCQFRSALPASLAWDAFGVKNVVAAGARDAR
jgi:hypothetical protein